MPLVAEAPFVTFEAPPDAAPRRGHARPQPRPEPYTACHKVVWSDLIKISPGDPFFLGPVTPLLPRSLGSLHMIRHRPPARSPVSLKRRSADAARPYARLTDPPGHHPSRNRSTKLRLPEPFHRHTSANSWPSNRGCHRGGTGGLTSCNMARRTDVGVSLFPAACGVSAPCAL